MKSLRSRNTDIWNEPKPVPVKVGVCADNQFVLLYNRVCGISASAVATAPVAFSGPAVARPRAAKRGAQHMYAIVRSMNATDPRSGMCFQDNTDLWRTATGRHIVALSLDGLSASAGPECCRAARPNLFVPAQLSQPPHPAAGVVRVPDMMRALLASLPPPSPPRQAGAAGGKPGDLPAAPAAARDGTASSSGRGAGSASGVAGSGRPLAAASLAERRSN